VPSRSLSAAIEHSFVLRNWCDEVVIDPEAATKGPRIGFLGRLSCDKGVDVLAEAFGDVLESHPDAELVIAGDGRFVSDAQQRAVAAALGNLPQRPTELGWVPPATLLSRCDIVVVPSTWAEPFGLVAIEAMSAGVPLLVSSAGALPELVGDGYPWIFTATDAGQLAATIEAMLSDGERAAAVAQASKERWRQRFSVEANAGRFMELLASASADEE
jgi:glycosyltransferase involved in cell wall biosynthesis